MNQFNDSPLANIWGRQFSLFIDNFRYFDVYLMNYEELEETLKIVHDIARRRKITVQDIFNSSNYNTYYGNFAHGMANKIVTLFRNGCEVEIIPYIQILFQIIVKYKLVDITTYDYYNLTPQYILFEFLANELNCDESLLTPTQLWCLNTSLKILDPYIYECIIVDIQKNIRRWLVKRRIRRMKYKTMLESILYAPSQQIENKIFTSFPGGSEYIALNQRFDDVSLEVQIHKVLLVN